MKKIILVFVKVSAKFDDGTMSVLFRATAKNGLVHNIWATLDSKLYKEGANLELDVASYKIESTECSDGKLRNIVAMR